MPDAPKSKPTPQDPTAGVLETQHTVKLNRGDLDPISQRKVTSARHRGFRPLLAIVAVLAALVATVFLMLRAR